jgi:ATP-binding cassette subfamily E protein 1
MLKIDNKSSRLAIVDYDKCKPTKCGVPCVIKCVVNQIGKICISIGDIEDLGGSQSDKKTSKQKAIISNNLCIGCGACVKVCPYEAIKLVNLPKELTKEKQLVSYGENSFRVYASPHIKKGQCLGIIGSNGLGKTSVIKVLSGDIKIDCMEKKKLLNSSELYAYLTKLQSNKLNVSYKPQDISIYNRGHNGNALVSTLLEKIPTEIQSRMNLFKLKDRMTKQLSGGETQRLLISLACSRRADAYLFDEPTAFLDIKQRIIAANLIQDIVANSYVVLIEHDLCIFDYISDYVVSLYGEKGAYGVISSVSSTFNGINNYLDGYLPTENIKFRDRPVIFKFKTLEEEEVISERIGYNYSACKFSYNQDGKKDSSSSFDLEIERGSFSTSEIILLIGENGTGKSTMIKILAGLIKVDGFERPELSVSIKEQEVYIDSELTVSEYIYKKIGNMMYNSDFKINVLTPLNVDKLFDLIMKNLSGGQFQRVAITVCLGTCADIYLLDEPSAYIDVEDRMVIAKMLRHYAGTTKKTIFLVEHDMIMATCTCDKVIVFTGEPGVKCKAASPLDIKTGINQFLKILGVTMRRDKYSGSGRPRINKKDSLRDREQKKNDQYFIIE